MDTIGLISFITGWFQKLLQLRKDRPRLKIDISLFRPDNENSRWIFRAKVINVGRIAAKNVEGFWSIFDAGFKEVTSGTSVFWSPDADNDYDYDDRTITSKNLNYNDRAYFWTEFEIDSRPIEKTNCYLFPYDSEPGLYYVAIVLEYGQFKSFQFLGLHINSKIKPSDSIDILNEKVDISWDVSKGIAGLKRRYKLSKFIEACSYHDYVRPT